MVTGGGLEVHSVHPSRQALRLDSTLPLQVRAWGRGRGRRQLQVAPRSLPLRAEASLLWPLR